MKYRLKIGLGIIIVIIAIIFLSIYLKSRDALQCVSTVWFGDVPLQVEIANTPEALKQGLMYRKKLPENQGMLFVFESPTIPHFWMKNTYIPLSIAFISANREIVQIDNMFPLDSLNFHFPRKSVKYAIEVNHGWFNRHKIKIGNRVKGIPFLKKY